MCVTSVWTSAPSPLMKQHWEQENQGIPEQQRKLAVLIGRQAHGVRNAQRVLSQERVGYGAQGFGCHQAGQLRDTGSISKPSRGSTSCSLHESRTFDVIISPALASGQKRTFWFAGMPEANCLKRAHSCNSTCPKLVPLSVLAHSRQAVQLHDFSYDPSSRIRQGWSCAIEA